MINLYNIYIVKFIIERWLARRGYYYSFYTHPYTGAIKSR